MIARFARRWFTLVGGASCWECNRCEACNPVGTWRCQPCTTAIAAAARNFWSTMANDDFELRIRSLWQLDFGCRSGDVGALIDAAIAVEAVTGEQRSPATWQQNLVDLGHALVEARRAARDHRPLLTIEDIEIAQGVAHDADQEFFTEIDHAIRSWEERIALPEKETEMPPRTRKPVAGIPATEEQAAQKEAEAAGQQLTWEDWKAQARKLHGRDFTTEQGEKLFDDFHKGLGPLIAVNAFPHEDDLDPWIREVEKLIGREIEESAECDQANAWFDAGVSAADAAARFHGKAVSVPAKPPAAASPAIVAEQWIPRGDIKPSPDNPRQHFDQVKLEQLAGSLKKHKQLQPILGFRHAERGLEIIDGERRWRASGIAKLPQVLVRILDVTEEEAIELRGIANLERDDLNAIEEALWMQQLIDKCGISQGALAKKLDCDQSHISQRLGLLKLPEEWQKAVMTREMDPTLARSAVPWMNRPAVLSAAMKLFQQTRQAGAAPSLREFKEIVEEAIEANSGTLHEWRCGFRVTDKNRDELDVQEVQTSHGKELRAFNLEAYDRLKKDAAKRKKARDKAEREKHQVGGSNAAKGKQKLASWECAKRVKLWLASVVKENTAKLLKDPLVRLRLFMLIRPELAGTNSQTEAGEWEYLAGLDRMGLEKVIRDSLTEMIADWENEWSIDLAATTLIRVVSLLGVTYSEAWRPTVEILKAYDVSYLKQAAKEAGLIVPKEMTDAWLAELVAEWPAGTLLPGFELEDLR